MHLALPLWSSEHAQRSNAGDKIEYRCCAGREVKAGEKESIAKISKLHLLTNFGPCSQRKSQGRFLYGEDGPHAK